MTKYFSIKSENFIKYYDLLSVCICLIGIVLSRFFMSAGIVLLIGRILIIGDWDEKLARLKAQKKILLVMLSFFFIHLLGLLWSNNISYGLSDINKKLPFLVIPIAFVLISPINKSILKYLIIAYIGSIFFGTIWGSTNYYSSINPDIRSLIPSTSHIRFSLNVCFSIFLSAIYLTSNWKDIKIYLKISCILINIWFIFYLILSQSATGLTLLIILLSIYCVFLLKKYNRKSISYFFIVLYITTLLVGISWTYHQYNFYFTPNKVYSEELIKRTPDGGVYISDFNNKLIENGNYLNMYLCEDEVMKEWEKITNIKYDETYPNGCYYKDLILRYINSKSPFKDGKAVRELTNQDIQNIKDGIENVVYAQEYSLKPRLYKTFHEFDYYKNFGKIKDFSLIQRIELWSNAKGLIKDNFWFGVGTGDISDKFEAKLKERNSPLYLSKMRAHNEYLTIFATFGLFGFIIFIFWLLFPAIKQNLFSNFIFLSFFSISIISMITEDTLDNMAGIMFFIFFYSLFVYNSSSLKNLTE